VNYLVNLAKESNNKGDYFPIWGTEKGMEALTLALTNDPSTLDYGLDQLN
jgi:hypothetical protein